MEQNYLDNPKLIEERVERLTDVERDAFDTGFAAALVGLMEDTVDEKRALLDSLLEKNLKTGKKIQLLSKVHVLDALEKHLKQRLTVLQPTF